MLLDARERQDDWFRDRVFDVCICGAGPAGITLARRLAAKGWTVALFESGGLEFDPDAQELNVGENVGLDYYPLDATRLRVLGGTSGHWAGVVRELDAHDFEPLDFNPLSGWPITRADIDPYAEESASILDLVPAEDPVDMFHGRGDGLRPTVLRFSDPPTRFNEKYRAELEASDRIIVYLNCTLVDAVLDGGLHGVETLVFRTLTDPEPFTVRGRVAVLALGGIENARFLLNASRQVPVGLGNQNDLVGRYFQEHPMYKLGSAILRDIPPGECVYSPTPRLMREAECLNFLAVAGFFGFGRGEPKRTLRKGLCSSQLLERVAEAVAGRDINCFDAEIYVTFEQALNPDSRVLLSDELDVFGQRHAALDWRLNELDFHTFRTAISEFGRRMALNDVGRIKVADWLLEANPLPPRIDEDHVASFHHIGTTRMSDDPKTGVVDGDCRVHGIDNLYIAGSSVFSTGGYANPTYTIVQLSLRLADHLDARLRNA